MPDDILKLQETTRAEIWNSRFPPGTPVTVIEDLGGQIETITVSEAWLLGGGHAVVKVNGLAGGYQLSRVIPRVT